MSAELKALLEGAVRGAPPETHPVAEVVGAARRAHVRRTRMVASAVSTLVVVIGIAGLVVALRPDRDAPVVDQTVDTTPGALVVVAEDHLRASPSDVNNSSDFEGYPAGSVAVTMSVPQPGRARPGMLTLVAAPSAIAHARDCDRLVGCAEVQTPSGSIELGWYDDTGLGSQGLVVAVGRRGEQMMMAVWTGHSFSGDPRQSDLAVSVDELVAIVSDPRFGVTTTPEAVARGRGLLPQQ